MTYLNIDIDKTLNFKGYLAQNNDNKAKPSILLIQEIFGVNSHIKSLCDYYSSLGYTVLAPDLFFRLEPGFNCGYTQEDMTKAFKYYGEYNQNQGLNDLKLAINYLQNMPSFNGKLGAIGYCLGGKTVYRLLSHYNQINCGVCYYGGGIDEHLDEANKITQPIMFHFGTLDSHITMDKVAKIKQAFHDKPNAIFYEYEADHGFNCDQRGSYNEQSSNLARLRSVEFFNKNLS